MFEAVVRGGGGGGEGGEGVVGLGGVVAGGFQVVSCGGDNVVEAERG